MGFQPPAHFIHIITTITITVSVITDLKIILLQKLVVSFQTFQSQKKIQYEFKNSFNVHYRVTRLKATH